MIILLILRGGNQGPERLRGLLSVPLLVKVKSGQQAQVIGSLNHNPISHGDFAKASYSHSIQSKGNYLKLGGPQLLMVLSKARRLQEM